MAPRLIINADDFGLTFGINRAVAELHCAGVLTSATLMATGRAFDDAVSIAKALPTLGIGCHIVLIDGMPVLPPTQIPTLIGPDCRTFRTTLFSFVRDFLAGRIDPDEIAYESLAQQTRLREAGLHVTHIDTHKHIHLIPAVTQALLKIGGARAIRNPFESASSRRVSGTPPLRRAQLALLTRARPYFERFVSRSPVRTTDGTLGIAATGTLTVKTLRQVLQTLPPEGTYELCCHPGYNDRDLDTIATRLRTQREIEREALLTVIPTLQTTQLIQYGNVE